MYDASLENEYLIKCLYGVDLNPESVEISKLSLWLRINYGKNIRKMLNEYYIIEIDEFKTKINEWKDNKENQINTLEETYKNKLQLEAPETLWESRAEKYRGKSERWIWYLLAFIVGLLASGGFFVISIHDYLQGTVKEIPFISKSFIYVALISFLIYIIRIIIKIIVSSQHMSMEYEQKAALTRFYQALIQDGKEVDKEEKLIIFNALFRKTDTGLIKSDNSNDADALLSQFSKLGK